MESQRHHFLVVTYPGQGHINPALNLAKWLVGTTGARVTFCTAISAHRHMFPSSAPDQEVEDGLLTYSPFSDGYDEGSKDDSQFNHFMSQLKLQGSRNLSNIICALASRGRPVTCVIYTPFVPWAADVAREHGVPSALFWIQPATVFAIYCHYFHGYDELIKAHADVPLFTVELPGLPPFHIRDLPSFCTISDDDPFYGVFATFKEAFLGLEREDTGRRLRVLVNSFTALEAGALEAMDKMELMPVGPLLPPSFIDGRGEEAATSEGDLIKPDTKKYMDWLDSKPEGSVVYVSFGSYAVLNKQQLEEISRGLAESRRPYLWVLRKNNRVEGLELEEAEEGMVVEWCSQVKVLSHPSVGCFVTHCGWNSMIESLTCGTPTVCVPLWTDQVTNARMAETAWGTGVKGQVNKEGVLEGRELRRCLDEVMGEGQRGLEIRRNAGIWMDKALEAVRVGGSSYRNLRALVEETTGDH